MHFYSFFLYILYFVFDFSKIQIEFLFYDLIFFGLNDFKIFIFGNLSRCLKTFDGFLNILHIYAQVSQQMYWYLKV